MEYIKTNHEGDDEVIMEYKRRFEGYTLEELVEAYNSQVRTGIVGVRRQMLYLTAMKQEFKERLSESPVYLIDHVIGMTGPIEVVNGNIRIVERS